MGDLLCTLKNRVNAYAERAVEACIREIPDFQAIAPVARASMLDFAVVIRHRTIDLVAADEPLHASDLAFIESVGEQRGRQGVSPGGQRSALALHSALALRDISEAAGPGDLDDTMQVLSWLVRHGGAAQAAHTRGYFKGQGRFTSIVARVQLLAAMLIRDDPAASELAKGLGMPVSERYVVTVIRVADPRSRLSQAFREELIGVLMEEHRLPLGWCEPDEFVALVPYGGGDPEAAVAAEGRALVVGRDFAEAAGRPCSIGTAEGRLFSLASAAALARKVSRVAPIERVPRRPYGMGDVFAELGAVQTPEVDGWLRDLAQRLSGGPDLVVTLDAYYHSDMDRMLTSMSLRIHPRTLDYRLHRVRDLVGIDPRSTRGVRVLSTAVTRALAGAWGDLHHTSGNGS
jgi:hypothetical protein